MPQHLQRKSTVAVIEVLASARDTSHAEHIAWTADQPKSLPAKRQSQLLSRCTGTGMCCGQTLLAKGSEDPLTCDELSWAFGLTRPDQMLKSVGNYKIPCTFSCALRVCNLEK